MRPLLLGIGLVACASAPRSEQPRMHAEPVPVTNPVAPAQPPLDARFVATIRDSAAPYLTWGRVEARPHVAPALCAPVGATRGSQGQVHLSEAEDAPHGKKLYYLWASQRDAYRALTIQPATMPVGFTIVKQSFEARASAPKPRVVHAGGEPALEDTIQVGNAWWTTGEAKDLFVMTKVGAGDGTDAGWIYGTIDPGGEVTSAGRVASCIGCHEDAPHDRLFGPKHP